MAPIIEYIDYRKYIRDFYEERKAGRFGFSWGAFAKLAGFSSPVFLQYVCEGKKNLSETTAPQVATAMGLAGYETNFFQLLVAFDNAKNAESKKKALDAITDLSRIHKVRSVAADEYDFFKSWKNALIRELAPAMPGATPRQMAGATRRHVTTNEVNDILEFLQQTGHLVKDENGNYHQQDRSLKMSGACHPELSAVRREVEGSSAASIRQAIAHDLQIQMAELAVDALRNENAEDRNITGLTIGITRENYERIVAELAECRRRIVAIATETDQTDEVYRLNMQLFPLTNLGEKMFRTCHPEQSPKGEVEGSLDKVYKNTNPLANGGKND